MISLIGVLWDLRRLVLFFWLFNRVTFRKGLFWVVFSDHKDQNVFTEAWHSSLMLGWFFSTEGSVPCLSSEFGLCQATLTDPGSSCFLKQHYLIFYSWIRNALPFLALDSPASRLCDLWTEFPHYQRNCANILWLNGVRSLIQEGHLSLNVARMLNKTKQSLQNKEHWKRGDTCYLMAVFVGCCCLRSVPRETVVCWCSVARKARSGQPSRVPSQLQRGERTTPPQALSRPAQPSFPVTTIECCCVFCPPSSTDPGCHLMRF